MWWSLWIGFKRNKAHLGRYMRHTLGLISPNRSTVLWCFLSAAPLTQLRRRQRWQNVSHQITHPRAYSPNEEVVLLMELTWNQIWTSQNWLWHLDCPPRRTPQTLPPSCHTIELLHAAHCKAFRMNQWQVTYTRTWYGSLLIWLHYQNTHYIYINQVLWVSYVPENFVKICFMVNCVTMPLKIKCR